MQKLFILSLIIFLGLGVFNVAQASELSGYVYTDDAGLISLNCQNTNSCDRINYRVSADNNGKLSGWGYSQESGWIDFNPKYGGASVSADNSVSGWVFAENNNWVNIASMKIISLDDLQNIFMQNVFDLKNLCNKFLNAEKCAVINH